MGQLKCQNDMGYNQQRTARPVKYERTYNIAGRNQHLNGLKESPQTNLGIHTFTHANTEYTE